LLLWFSYFEIAADLLVCLPFLWYLNLVSSPVFFTSKKNTIACGIAGALAYLSKSYFFPYFLLHFSLMQYFAFRQCDKEYRRKLLLRNMAWGIGIFIITCSAWVITLSYKFGKPTIGFAGEYNYKQSIYPKKPLPLLGEPLVPGSTHPWEDISTAMDVLYTTPAPGQWFIKQLKVLAFEGIQMIKNFNELSVFSFAIIFLTVIYLRRKTHRLLWIALLTVITLPMGYVLMHIETRYIWTNAFLLMLAGGYLVQQLFDTWKTSKRMTIVGWSIFLGSFCIFPIHNLYKSVGLHKEVFVMARQISEWKVKGRFASNDADDIIGRACYLTENVYLVMNARSFTDAELTEQLRSQNVEYYFFQYQTAGQLEAFQNSAFYKQYEKQQIQKAGEWIVFSLR
jgi:hypothetical protein